MFRVVSIKYTPDGNNGLPGFAVTVEHSDSSIATMCNDLDALRGFLNREIHTAHRRAEYARELFNKGV